MNERSQKRVVSAAMVVLGVGQTALGVARGDLVVAAFGGVYALIGVS